MRKLQFQAQKTLIATDPSPHLAIGCRVKRYVFQPPHAPMRVRCVGYFHAQPFVAGTQASCMRRAAPKHCFDEQLLSLFNPQPKPLCYLGRIFMNRYALSLQKLLQG
jgi:hypothetical protein